MNREFDYFWNDLKNSLNMPQKISNWTKDNGFIGNDFTAQYKDEKFITCMLDNGKIIKVPKGEFHKMYKKWDDYISNILPRSEIVEQSRFTKYVISIFHQYLDLMDTK
ncbi:MAG: hypothetical protein ACYDAJ_02875 [Nitrosotalea sp.]